MTRASRRRAVVEELLLALEQARQVGGRPGDPVVGERGRAPERDVAPAPDPDRRVGLRDGLRLEPALDLVVPALEVDPVLGPQALLIRYEDLCKDPRRELGRLLDFLARPLAHSVSERIAASVQPSRGLGRGLLDPSDTIRALGTQHAETLRRFGYPTPV